MANFRLNVKQAITLLVGGSMIVSALDGMANHPSIALFLLSALITYWTARLFYLTADPIDEEVFLTSKAQTALSKGICPFCATEPIAPQTLKVGYKKGRYSNFKYKVFWIEWSHSYHELNIRLPICDGCRTKYLTACLRRFPPKGMRNPCKIVLKRKLGYRRGIQFPFESWNLKSILDE